MTSVSLEAHSVVLREEISRLNADISLIAALQARYGAVLSQAAGLAADESAATAGRRGSGASVVGLKRGQPKPGKGNAATPTSGQYAGRPFLSDALSTLRDTHADKSGQLSRLVTQQAATDDALRRAAALADEVRYRDVPSVSSAADGHHFHTQQLSQHYTDVAGFTLHAPAPQRTPAPASYDHSYFAGRPIIAPSSPAAPMAAERSLVAPPAQIGFDPPLVVGGWRSYLRGTSPPSAHAAAEAAVEAPTPRLDYSNLVAGAPLVRPSALTPMLVVLPSGSATNLSTGVTPVATRRY